MKPRRCKHADPPCRSCIGKRNRARGLAKQRIVFKMIGLEWTVPGTMSTEERWAESPLFPGMVLEVKSGKLPAYQRQALDQIERRRKDGQRAGVVIVPEGSQRPYLIVDLEDEAKARLA